MLLAEYFLSSQIPVGKELICLFYERVIWPKEHLNNLLEVTQLVSDGARMWTQHCLIVMGSPSFVLLPVISRSNVNLMSLPKHPHMLNP